MNEGKIAVRYGKALFSFAKELSLLDDIKKDILLIREFIKDNDLQNILYGFIIKTSEKKKLVEDIFKGIINDYTLNFIKLVIDNRKEKYLNRIFNVYNKLYNEEKGIKEALLILPFETSEEIILKIKDFIQRKLKYNIELQEKIDRNIIGGFILRIEDKQLDVSTATYIKNIRNNLLYNNIKH